MNFPETIIEKAKDAKTPEELLTLAKENNIELSAKEAGAYFARLHKIGELSDDELDNVSGGGCGEPSDPPKFKTGDHVLKEGLYVCNLKHPFCCSSDHWIVDSVRYSEVHGYQYTVHCPICNASVQPFESSLVKK